jgi:hypothetical protein
LTGFELVDANNRYLTIELTCACEKRRAAATMATSKQ